MDELSLPRVIFVGGGLASGKGTLCELLRRQYGYRVIHMVEPFKRRIAEELGISFEELERDKVKYRPLLQRKGHEWRQADPDCMLKLLAGQLNAEAGPVVVDGVRFVNEMLFAIERGYFTVRLDVPREERVRRAVEREYETRRRRTPGLWLDFDHAAVRAAIEERMDDPTEAEVGDLPAHLVIDWTKNSYVGLYPLLISSAYAFMCSRALR